MYERHAITSHVEKNHKDPITRLPLRIDQLTPVYVLRVRAAEYRESAAAACLEAACSADCINPVSTQLAGNSRGHLAPNCMSHNITQQMLLC